MTTTTQALADVIAKRDSMTGAANWQAVEDGYAQGQLAASGGCYALNASGAIARGKDLTGDLAPPAYLWPLAKEDYTPTTVRADLVEAAARILGEIERLDRMAAQSGGEG